ncbi:hypothetical protein THAOC_15415 [Thalassiosira oceanica]|uniref:Uncharacterized protein n=1 Tax=Thalassiosira oceanica TaxID=159749 RepID=K0T097_THAOC|nr:hypothetical protein THAOC_15415 [Thalassiosira oceanica]|eukprot:EJK63902.1 hypothetical protein THAOC_15415 [Thalassiosira oceanica]
MIDASQSMRLYRGSHRRRPSSPRSGTLLLELCRSSGSTTRARTVEESGRGETFEPLDSMVGGSSPPPSRTTHHVAALILAPHLHRSGFACRRLGRRVVGRQASCDDVCPPARLPVCLRRFLRTLRPTYGRFAPEASAEARAGARGSCQARSRARPQTPNTAPRGRPDHELITMATETAFPDDCTDMGTTGSPPRTSPPNNAPSQQATGDDSAAATPLAQEPAQGATAASASCSLGDDDPPIPVLHVVEETEGNVSDGPQLHDGPTGPPRFPLEHDDSLAKRIDGLEQHSSDHVNPAGPPPCFPSEFDVSVAKRADNELERNRPDHTGEVGRNRSDHAGDNVSTARSTMGASVASTAEAAAGPSMVEGVEEGSSSSRGTSPSMSSRTELVEATATVGLNPPSEGRSTFIAEAYRVEEAETQGGGTVYEAELAEPNVVLRFYQRKGFASVIIAVTLLLVGIAVATVVLLSKNLPSDDKAETSSVATDFQTPVPTNVPTVTVTAPTSSPVKNLTWSPTTKVS